LEVVNRHHGDVFDSGHFELLSRLRIEGIDVAAGGEILLSNHGVGITGDQFELSSLFDGIEELFIARIDDLIEALAGTAGS